MVFHNEEGFKILSGEKVSSTQLDEWYNFSTTEDLIEYFYHVYPNEHYFNYPEFTVNKLRLSHRSLNSLPEKTQRTRKHIREWMTNQRLSVDEWIYVGW